MSQTTTASGSRKGKATTARDFGRRKSIPNITVATAAAAPAATDTTNPGAGGPKSFASARLKAKVNSVRTFAKASNMNKKVKKSSTSASTVNSHHNSTLTVKSHVVHKGHQGRTKSNRLSPTEPRSSERSSSSTRKTEKEATVTQYSDDSAAPDTEESGDEKEAEKKPLTKQSSLDELMAKVMGLKSLHDEVITNTAKDKEGKVLQLSHVPDDVPNSPSLDTAKPEGQNFQVTVEEPPKDETEPDVIAVAEETPAGNQDIKNEAPEANEASTPKPTKKPNFKTIPNMESICGAFASTIKTDKRSLKDVARSEMIREETSILDRMMADSKTMAVGRRQFDEDEIVPEDDEEEEEDEEELAVKIKKAKPRYMEMFAKPKPEPEPEQEEQIDTNPKNYGLWDAVSDVKILPTLLKVKREWHPPDWEKILQTMKEEGRDVASIDADLKEISQTKERGKKKTGKYLMPEDLGWCRKHTRFSERDLLKWFKRFRNVCDQVKGEIGREAFMTKFKDAFPTSEPEPVAEIVFDIFREENKDGLDFKDFIMTMDVISCKTTHDKLRWATSLCDRKHVGSVSATDIKTILILLDQVENNGFTDAPPQEEMDEMMFRRKLEPLRLVDDRVNDIWQRCDVQPDGRIDINELLAVPDKIIYSRD